MNVRVRGIYTTALTELLRADHEVVQASPPIRERFDAEFSNDVAAVTVDTTDDRQGVGIAGEPDAVAAIRERLHRVGRDAFAWDDPAPRGGVFRGVVTETLGSGAVVDLGRVPRSDTERATREPSDPRAVEGFLPYDRVDGYVDEGDSYRVQVAGPDPPWSDSRPSLATDLRIPGELVELRRGDRGSGGETARMADLLPVDPPEGWAPRWARAADDASLDAMAAALERAGERAEALMAAVADAEGEEPGRIAAPQSGAWVWFGRESRFELDEHRRAVATTMPGHHRTKAATDAASAAVDFAEALCEPSDEFPFDVVTRQFGPAVGDRVAIEHGKPDGRRLTLGRGEVTERDPEGSVVVEREMSGGGTYDAIGVERRAGDVARTTFVEGRWWYATVYDGSDGERRGTYVNVCTPVEVFPAAVRYVDLHVDVVKGPDGDVRRVDDDELDAAVAAGEVREPLAGRAREVAASIESAL
jgi:Ribonuclease G/E